MLTEGEQKLEMLIKTWNFFHIHKFHVITKVKSYCLFYLFRFVDFLWTEMNSSVRELALTVSLKILMVAEGTRYTTSKLKIDYLEKWNQSWLGRQITHKPVSFVRTNKGSSTHVCYPNCYTNFEAFIELIYYKVYHIYLCSKILKTK